jgi:hypothetical protein
VWTGWPTEGALLQCSLCNRSSGCRLFFFFLIVMAVVFHKTKQQNKMLQVPISRRALQKRAK